MTPLVTIERPASGTPRGVLWLLHGVGGNERNLEAVAAEQSLDVHVILARGPRTYAPGSHGWFDVRFEQDGPRIDPVQAEASRLQLIHAVAGHQARSGIGPQRNLVAGFSQGGIMSAGIALTTPQLVAGFGLVSGRILPEITPHMPDDLSRDAPHGLVLHGRRDSKLPYAMAEASAALLARLGVPHTLHAYDEDHAFGTAMRHDFRAWVETRLSTD